jgi:hypothetical protein
MPAAVSVLLDFFGHGSAAVTVSSNNTYHVDTDPKGLFSQESGAWAESVEQLELKGDDSADLVKFRFNAVTSTSKDAANHNRAGLGEWRVISIFE